MTSAARKNVTTACTICRDSKTKCDGATPQCAPCLRKGKACRYEPKEDKRRVSFRPALGILRRRLDELTDALSKVGAPIPPMDISDESLANKVLESVGMAALPRHKQSLPTNEIAMPSESSFGLSEIGRPNTSMGSVHQHPQLGMQYMAPALSLGSTGSEMNTGLDDGMSFTDWSHVCWDDTVSPDWPWATFLASDFEVPSEGSPSLGMMTASQPKPALSANANGTSADDSGHDDEADPDIVNQIAARFGSLHIAPDGKLRYFGTPANAHLFTSSKDSHVYANPRSVHTDGDRLLRNAELNQHVDPAFEEHLISIYFSWHNSCHPIVDSYMYWTVREKCTDSEDSSGFYSEVLTNAMCAIGASYEAKYHPSLVTFPRPLAEFFAERARILLDIELDSPCVSTVQSLLLLSSHEAGCQRMARSWLYSGMAMRLCFDLGLHIDTSPYVERGVISTAEAKSRQVAFWGSYTLNYRASFSLGRPFTLDWSEIRVAKPSGSLERSYNGWQKYPPDSDDHNLTQSTRSGETVELVHLVSGQRVMLYDIVEPIARALYGNTTITNKALQEVSERATSAMFNWKRMLPEALQMPEESNSTVAPQLLVLHLEYHYLQILIHRPWTSRRHQPSPAQGPGYRHARRQCVESACEMAHILTMFEKRFGYRRLNVETTQILPSAALILIFASVSKSDPEIAGNGPTADLNTVLRALDELSSTYSSAREHLESLLLIQRRWCTIYGQQQKKKRAGITEDGVDWARQPKRSRGVTR